MKIRGLSQSVFRRNGQIGNAINFWQNGERGDRDLQFLADATSFDDNEVRVLFKHSAAQLREYRDFTFYPVIPTSE